MRVVVNAPTSFTVRESHDAERVSATDEQARCSDLSAGGMRLLTTKELADGDQLALKVKLRHPHIPNGELNLVARVLRIATWRYDTARDFRGRHRADPRLSTRTGRVGHADVRARPQAFGVSRARTPKERQLAPKPRVAAGPFHC